MRIRGAAKIRMTAAAAAAVVVVAVAGCGQSAAEKAAPSASVASAAAVARQEANAAPATTTTRPAATDPVDAAFIAAIRDQNLAPKVPASLDGALLADAQNVCNLAEGVPGESASMRATDMLNLRKNRVSNYGITEGQAEEVMILSTETYCADQTQFVRTALT